MFDYAAALDRAIVSNKALAAYLTDPYPLDDYIDLGDGLHITSGLSRIVLIADDSDYIIKFDMNNTHYCEQEKNICSKSGQFQDCFAKCINSFNYHRKIKIYNDITGVEYFTQDIYDDTPNSTQDINYTFYVYEKAQFHPMECALSLPSRGDSPLTEFSIGVGNEFYCYLGEKKYEEFSNFLKENKISDIHPYNFGYICNRPVLIDYTKEIVYES